CQQLAICLAPARGVLGARRRAFARGMRRARGLACFQILQRERARRARLCRYHDLRYRGARRRLRRGQAPFQRQGDRGIDRAHWDLQYECARAAGAPTRPRAVRALSFSEFFPVPANSALVVEDDRFLRVVAIVLDPNTSPERTAAYADFFAHDEPDFDGYCKRMRARVGRLFPREVRLVETQDEMRRALPGSPAPVVESLPVGKEDTAAANELRAVQKYGLSPRHTDTAACAAKGIKVLPIRRRANIACAELAIGLMLTLAKKLHRLAGRISVEQLGEVGYAYKPFDRRHTPNSNWPRISGLRVLNGATLGIIGLGEIGREIAIRAAAFGMQILYYQRTRLPASEEREL